MKSQSRFAVGVMLTVDDKMGGETQIRLSSVCCWPAKSDLHEHVDVPSRRIRPMQNDFPVWGKKMMEHCKLTIKFIRTLGLASGLMVLMGSVNQLQSAPRSPASDGGAELETLLVSEDGKIDLAIANWLVAAKIPEFQDLQREVYFSQVEKLTEEVRQNMATMEKVALARGENPKSPKTRCAIFCNAILQLGFAYTEEFRQEQATPEILKHLYADPKNISLVGLLQSKRGSCVSMPLIYLVIGQRLDLPVYLVTIGRHYFIRWDEPGYRINIEPTIVTRVAVTSDDSVYLETEGMTRAQVTGSELRNLTNREVVGNLLFARSAYWATKGMLHTDAQRRDLERAKELAGDDPAIKASYEAVFNRAAIKPASIPIQPK
jgi:hypothetical protein